MIFNTVLGGGAQPPESTTHVYHDGWMDGTELVSPHSDLYGVYIGEFQRPERRLRRGEAVEPGTTLYAEGQYDVIFSINTGTTYDENTIIYKTADPMGETDRAFVMPDSDIFVTAIEPE